MPEVFPGVSVDATHNFGRPRLTEHGIVTDVLAAQFIAGDGVELIARWLRIPEAAVEAALRWELLDRRKRKRLIEKASKPHD